MRSWIALVFAIVVVDHATKLAADYWLAPYAPLPLLPSLNLTLVYNTGAAFSLLADAGGWQRWFLIGIALAVCALLWSWLVKLDPAERVSAAGISLVLGGAAANAMDRLVRGHVVDFLDVYYRGYHWPTFNVADACITVGALLIVYTAVVAKDRSDGSSAG